MEVASFDPPTGCPITSSPRTHELNEKAHSEPNQLVELSVEDALVKLTAINAVRPILHSGEQTAVALLGSSDRRVRLKAIEVLKASGTNMAREALHHLRSDPDPEVRDRATEEAKTLRPSAVNV
jgi:hypothetical protein